MQVEATYREVQTLRSPWVLLLGLALALLPFGIVYLTAKEVVPATLLVSTMMGIIIPATIWSLRLTVQIDQRGVSYEFRPFVKAKLAAWGNLVSVEVNPLNPLRDFGGWGLRYTIRGNEGYIVRGKYGLTLRWKSGRKLTLSITHPAAAKAALAQHQPQYMPLITI